MVMQLWGMLEPTELYTLKEGILWYVNYLHVDFLKTNALEPKCAIHLEAYY